MYTIPEIMFVITGKMGIMILAVYFEGCSWGRGEVRSGLTGEVGGGGYLIIE